MKVFSLIVYFKLKRITLWYGRVGGIDEEEEEKVYLNYSLFFSLIFSKKEERSFWSSPRMKDPLNVGVDWVFIELH